MSEANKPGVSQDEQRESVIETECKLALDKLGVSDIAEFGGLYTEDSNARARTDATQGGKWCIEFNEQNIAMDKRETERVVWHEAQHILWSKESLISDATWLFVFHPNFENLHARMAAHYAKYSAQNYPFKKELKPLPNSYDEMGTANDNYAHPDELLALLRGYERYLRQQETYESGLASEPYEFIEAFTPEDLKFLNLVTREQLASEVNKIKPDILSANKQIRDVGSIDIVWG